MTHESRTCQQCKNAFLIQPEDFAFYEKMKVPPPTWCPQCRLIRRLVWRNERTLHHRTCDRCGMSLISMYSAHAAFPVYCNDCWWSDAWSGFDYAQEYDFSLSFFEQLADLQARVPRLYLDTINNENSAYTNISFNNKNCYLIFASADCEEAYYCRKVVRCKNVIDCTNVTDSELCYGCIDCQYCYHSSYLQNCKRCNDSMFLMNCSNCSDCVFCCNLSQKQYCIFNKQLTREEYFLKIKEFDLGSYGFLQKNLPLFEEYKKSHIHRESQNVNCVNCTGDYLTNCASCVHCFDIAGSEQCARVTDSLTCTLDSMDCTAVGMNSEQMYECVSCTKSRSCLFSHGIREKSFEIYYSDHIYSSNDLFGCVGFKKAERCILNKRYGKQEYTDMVHKIVEQMKEMGEFGSYFPVSLSPFGYNESTAMQFFPLTKEKAIAQGFRWQDDISSTHGKETVQQNELADTVQECDEHITREILACRECGRNYKIIKQEFIFYKEQNIALPRICPDCRYAVHVHLRQGRTLYHRQCMCEKSDHNHAARCPMEFETTYAPDRPESVYCESCYQKEIL